MEENFCSFYSNFILNLYIVYELNNWLHNLSIDVILALNGLFGSVKLIKCAVESKCQGIALMDHVMGF